MNLRISGIVLSLSLLALFVFTLLSGLAMPFRASMLPVLASSMAIPLMLLALYFALKDESKENTQVKDSDGDLVISENELSPDAFRRVKYFFIWFASLLATAHFFGFLLGLPIMVLFYLIANREPFKLSMILSLTVLVILYFGFQKGLVLPLPEGVLTSIIFGT